MMPAASPSARSAHVIVRSSKKLSVLDLESLWDEMLRRRWIDPGSGRVTVRAGKTWFLPVVEQTVRSLTEYLTRKAPEIRSVYSFPGEDQAIPLIQRAEKVESSASHFSWRTLSCCWPDGVPVSSEWLLPGSLVTIAAPGPDRQLRYSSALSAQAEMLNFPVSRYRAFCLECTYEAHRLLRSDALVVCGPVSRFDPQKGWFWAASNSDIGVEVAVARAAGIRAEELPHVRFLEKHEMVNLEKIAVEGEWPRLEGYSASRLSAWTVRGYWKIRGQIMLVGDDLSRMRKNFPRLSAAIRRRLAKRIKG